MPNFDSILNSATGYTQQVSIPTVFNVLLWVLGLPMGAIIILSIVVPYSPVVTFFMWIVGIAAGLIFILFVIVLGLGIFKDPKLLTLLRSEGFALGSMLIEARLMGDSSHNYVDIKDSPETNNPMAPDPTTEKVPQPNELTPIEQKDHNG